MKSYRTDGWSSRPRRHTFTRGDFPVIVRARFATGGETCRQPTTTAVRAEHVKLSTVIEAEPLHAHGHGTLGSTGEGGTSTAWETERTEPNWTLPRVWGKQFFFLSNWADTRTLQQKLPALFLSLACWGETFSIFPFAHRVRRDRVCECG